WLPRDRGRPRRVQWQVHDQSDDVARQLSGYAGRSFACHVSQLLLSAAPLAVHRPAPRGLPVGSIMPALARALEPYPSSSTFAADVIAGLKAEPKRLPAKYFYDNAGALLFDRITKLPEYYPTRTELSILNNNAAAIAQLFPPRGALVEFGSGSSVKASIMLAAAPQLAAYCPVDISSEVLHREAELLQKRFPNLAVVPVDADFTQPFELPPEMAALP